MTRNQFWTRVKLITAVYLIALLLGIGLRIIDFSNNNVYYNTFKDLLSLVIALPAAYLGYCLQQRASFLQFLRATWLNLAKAVNRAILYTQTVDPDKKEYIEVLNSLRIAIDELRGIYKNVGESSGQHGLYPVSPILDIYKKIENLNEFGLLNEKEFARRQKIRGEIFDSWKSVRRVLLTELDRPNPTYSDIRREYPNKQTPDDSIENQIISKQSSQ